MKTQETKASFVPRHYLTEANQLPLTRSPFGPGNPRGPGEPRSPWKKKGNDCNEMAEVVYILD